MKLRKIGLLLSAGGDRALLEVFLREHGQQVVLPIAGPIDVDVWDSLSLIMVDEAALSRHHLRLAELKAHGNFVPLLLIIPSRSQSAAKWLGGNTVDDVLRMPVSKAELAARLRVLVRLSEQSRAVTLKFERLFEDASWGVMVAHPHTLQLQEANEAFAAMHGYTPQELRGSTLEGAIGAPAWTDWKAQLPLILERGSVVFETVHARRDGHAFPVEIDATLYLDQQGGPDYLAAFVRDISERTQNEQKLQRQHKELEEARDLAEQATLAKSDFLANISHEIRTPLNGVMATLPLLLKTPLSAEAKEYAELIVTSSEALRSLVDEILDFSNIEAGKMVLDLTSIGLAELVTRVVDTFRIQAAAKHIELRCNLHPDLPPRVLGDPLRLRQILRNLLSNALKFTEVGSVEVSAFPDAEPGTVHFLISDTGIGVAAEDQAHIFDAFTQADASTTRRYGGTGLGLGICQGLVQLMQGRMGLESELGVGSRFHVVVPLAPPPAKTPQQTAGRSLRILVCDDNPLNLKIMSLLLNSLGHQAVLAEDAKAGLRLYGIDHFDAILMDLQMPGMSGLEATAVIRQLELESGQTHTPIIAVTARALHSDRENCLAAGMENFFTKPINVHDLGAALDRLTS